MHIYASCHKYPTTDRNSTHLPIIVRVPRALHDPADGRDGAEDAGDDVPAAVHLDGLHEAGGAGAGRGGC